MTLIVDINRRGILLAHPADPSLPAITSVFHTEDSLSFVRVRKSTTQERELEGVVSNLDFNRNNIIYVLVEKFVWACTCAYMYWRAITINVWRDRLPVHDLQVGHGNEVRTYATGQPGTQVNYCLLFSTCSVRVSNV